MEGTILVGIQDIATTNSILSNAGFYNGKPLGSSDLCNILGVDGILTSNYSLSKPMSEGAAIAMAILLDSWGPAKEVVASLSIFDSGSAKLIWNFDHKLSSSFGSPAKLVDELMRQASRKMPYFTDRRSY